MEENKSINYIKIAIGFGVIALWLSLWFSYQHLPFGGSIFDPNAAIAKGGFPFTVFYYPPPPMGKDIPPDGSFFPFALNFMIWFIVAYAIIHFIPKRIFTEKLVAIITYLAFLMSLFGLFYIIIQFD